MNRQQLCPCDKKMTLPQDAGADCPYCGKPLNSGVSGEAGKYGLFGSKKNLMIFIAVDAVITLIFTGFILYFFVLK